MDVDICAALHMPEMVGEVGQDIIDGEFWVNLHNQISLSIKETLIATATEDQTDEQAFNCKRNVHRILAYHIGTVERMMELMAPQHADNIQEELSDCIAQGREHADYHHQKHEDFKHGADEQTH
jgi:hypothetical protein